MILSMQLIDCAAMLLLGVAIAFYLAERGLRYLTCRIEELTRRIEGRARLVRRRVSFQQKRRAPL